MFLVFGSTVFFLAIYIYIVYMFEGGNEEEKKDNPDKHFTCTFHIVFALWAGLLWFAKVLVMDGRKKRM